MLRPGDVAIRPDRTTAPVGGLAVIGDGVGDRAVEDGQIPAPELRFEPGGVDESRLHESLRRYSGSAVSSQANHRGRGRAWSARLAGVGDFEGQPVRSRPKIWRAMTHFW